MRKGLTGNNLSAGYVGTYIHHIPSLFTQPRMGVQWGNQKQLFKKVYYDLKILFDLQTPENNSFFNRFGIAYKVGLAF